MNKRAAKIGFDS